MNVILNSRVLIGANHHAAERIARHWRPDMPKKVEWKLSPSDLCVLRIDPEPDQARNGRRPSGDMLRLANSLEIELRTRLRLVGGS
jgi:hypothetical protein